ncbi:hypothetical protein Q31b_47350 [Novipirellula aureliae]|uniref:Uncharacterized protein n=1 Tax=Novipirellula aureliae TaxID=2527966 RepID=A0A5C6DSB3_9BACT|nr:hypothetical protein [Novipirellula aureliae]TWU37946.1 hypothetical protein Q31b_47350 [Novipirellula aureliae]
MTTRITVGVRRKHGQPNFGSHGADCHIDFEIGGDPLAEPDGQLTGRIREAFHLCRQEVERELAVETTKASEQPSRDPPQASQRTNGQAPAGGNGQSRIREATEAQIRAIHAIASKANVHLASQLETDFDVSTPKQLTLRQASDLIEKLKSRLNQTAS